MLSDSAPRISRSLLLLLAGLLAPLLSGQQHAAVSRTAPEIYESRIKALFTPLEEVLSQRENFPEREDFGGAVLLHEWIYHVADDGRTTLVRRDLYLANSESGKEAIEQNVYRHRAATQEVHVVEARSHQPDGSIDEVRPNAMFFQSPQDDADSSLYSDVGEVIVLFPKIGVGTVTEAVIVREEEEARVPGEFMFRYSWSTGWPIWRSRFVVDVPRELADRIHEFDAGTTPEVVRTETDDGARVRLEWIKDHAQPLRREANMESALLRGPTTWLTTWSDWDDLAKWYSKLISGRSALGPELSTKVEEWTEGVDDPKEILAILYDKVANEVRYVGLEFGIAGLQPYPSEEVWTNRYGDCKDKANLLRAMLAKKGIDSAMTLVTTDHRGRILKQAPSYSQFNHAILAVPKNALGDPKAKGWLFCDPTVEKGRPGLLPPGDSGREVLVIKNGESAEFVRTPDASIGTLDYDLDLEWKENGELTGWMTLTASGIYGAWLRSETEGQIQDAQIDALGPYVYDLFENAEIVDVEIPESNAGKGKPFKARAYFVERRGGEGEERSFSFPMDPGLIPGYGEDRERRTPFYQWKDLGRISFQLELPEGWGPTRLPRSYSADSPGLKATSEWSFGDSLLKGELEIRTHHSVVPAKDFPATFNVVAALRNWLDRPVVLSGEAAADGAAPTAPTGIDLKNFPMMPSGQGQINLANARFPRDGGGDLRREALLRVQQYFPDDKNVVFEAEVELALLDSNEGLQEEGVARLRRILRRISAEECDHETRGWAHYMLGIMLPEEEAPEAIKLFVGLANDKRISPFRRGWSCYQMGELRSLDEEGADDDETIEILKERVFDGENSQTELVALLSGFLARQNRMKELGPILEKLKNQEVDLAPVLERMTSQEWVGGQEMDRIHRAALAGYLGKKRARAVFGIDAGEAERLAASLVSAGAVLRTAESIREKLRERIEKSPPSWVSPIPKLEPLDTPEQYEDCLAELNSEETDKFIARALDYLVRFEPTADFPYWYWRLCAHVVHKEDGLGLFKWRLLATDLFDWAEELPQTEENYWEIQFTLASHHHDHERYEEELQVFERMGESPLFPDDFSLAYARRMGLAFELLGRHREAAETYEEVPDSDLEYEGAPTAVIRAAVIRHELGELDEAMRLFETLSQVESFAEDEPLKQQCEEMAAMARKPDQLRAYWETASSWEPEWEALRDAMKIEEPEGVVVSLFGNPDALQRSLTAEFRDDRAGFEKLLLQAVHGARWQPEFVLPLGSWLGGALPELQPDLAKDAAELALALLLPFECPDPDLTWRTRLQGGIVLTDLEGRVDECLEVCQQFFEQKEVPQDSSTGHVAARLDAIARIQGGADLTEATERLEKILAITEIENSRDLTVDVLCTSYLNQNRSDDAIQLLEKEAKHPVIVGSSEASERIKARLESLKEGGRSSVALTRAAKRWLERKAHLVPWFEHAQPATLDEVEDVEEALEDLGPQTVFADHLKLQFLAVRDSDLGAERKMEILAEFLTAVAQSQPTVDRWLGTYSGFYDNKHAPAPARTSAFISAFVEMLVYHDGHRIEELLEHPLCEGDINDTLVDAVKLLAEHDSGTVKGNADLIKELTGKALASGQLLVLRTTFERILALGGIDEASRIAKSAAKWRFDGSVDESPAAIRLDLLKKIREARKLQPVHGALAEVVLAAYPPPVGRLDGEDLPRMSGVFELGLLEREKRLAVILRRIDAGDFYGENLAFWNLFAEALPREPASDDLVLEITRAGVPPASEEGDETLEMLIGIGGSALDLDEPDLLARYLEAAGKADDARKFPMTSATLRTRETLMKMRQDPTEDVEIAFETITERSSADYRTRIRLDRHLALGDRDAVNAILDETDPDTLLNPMLLHRTIAACELCEREDEAELYREELPQALRTALFDQWMNPSRWAGRIFDLAEAGDADDLVPEAWFKDAVAATKDSFDRVAIAVRWHRLQGEPEEVIKSADILLEGFPTFYDFYFYRGSAHAELDHREKALADLRVYLKYGANEPDYQTALELVEELEQENGLPAE